MEPSEEIIETQEQVSVDPRKNGLCIASFIISILALLTSLLVVPGLLGGILALIFGIVGIRAARRRNCAGRTLGIWGIALSGLSILVSLVFGLVMGIIFVEVIQTDEFKQNLRDEVEQMRETDPEGAKNLEKIVHFLDWD